MTKAAWAALLILISGSSCVGTGDAPPNPLEALLKGTACDVFEQPEVTHARVTLSPALRNLRGGDRLGELVCLGYLHGRDRAWQMSFLRRIAQGRRAELLGPSAVHGDLQMRMLGLGERAQALFSRMPEEQQAPFWAYAYGINQGFRTDRARDSYELKHYGGRYEAWMPSDSLAILLLQSFDQTKQTFVHKLDEANWLKERGDLARALFARGGLPWSTTILKKGEYRVGARASAVRAVPEKGVSVSLAGPEAGWFDDGAIGEGSNNWAISPGRSLTGHAFLANDPHLETKRPPFWYWAHIQSGGIDVIGASLPGAPLFASGTNGHVAWGLTNSYFDVTELADVPKSELTGGASTSSYPLVWVRIAGIELPFFFYKIQRTRMGWPVLPVSEAGAGRAVILRWSGFELEPRDFDGLFDLMSASSAKELDANLSKIGLPSWNFAFADTGGAIGYRTVGKLPKRINPLPFGVPEKSLADWGPWEYLSPDEAPHVLDPPRGYVVTANNLQWPENSLYLPGRAQTSPFRAFRIEELLKAKPRHDRLTLQKIQCDEQAVDARFLAPLLLDSIRLLSGEKLSPLEVKELDALMGWDFGASVECRPCAVYERWKDRLLSEEHVNLEGLYRLLAARDQSQTERKRIAPELLSAFRGAVRDVGSSDTGELKSWGEFHENRFQHFSGDPAFSVEGIPTGGVENSVSPGSARWSAALQKYEQTSGASQRIIIEMSDPPQVYAVLAGANQDLESPNLTDPSGPWMKWRRCELERRSYPLDWSQVKARSEVMR